MNYGMILFSEASLHHRLLREQAFGEEVVYGLIVFPISRNLQLLPFNPCHVTLHVGSSSIFFLCHTGFYTIPVVTFWLTSWPILFFWLRQTQSQLSRGIDRPLVLVGTHYILWIYKFLHYQFIPKSVLDRVKILAHIVVDGGRYSPKESTNRAQSDCENTIFHVVPMYKNKERT